MNNKAVTIALILTFLIGVIAGYNLIVGNANVHKNPQVNANVFVVIDGTKVYESGNVMTDIAENNVRDWMAFGNQSSSSNVTSCISLGNATVSQTLTKLTVEATTANFSRVNGTISAWYNGTDRAFNVTYTFTASDTIAVNATGLHWSLVSNSDNNMAACAYLTDGTMHQFPALSTAQVTWVITIDAN